MQESKNEESGGLRGYFRALSRGTRSLLRHIRLLYCYSSTLMDNTFLALGKCGGGHKKDGSAIRRGSACSRLLGTVLPASSPTSMPQAHDWKRIGHALISRKMKMQESKN